MALMMLQVDSGFHFTGNTDQNTAVEVLFSAPIYTRYLRIHPLTWESSIGLRIGVLHCGGNYTTTATTMYTLPSAQQQLPLHTSAIAGDWGVCYKLERGVWQRMTGLNLQVIAQPRFTPPVAIAGSITTMTYVGQNEPGDFVVLQENDCSNAHLTSMCSLAA